MNPLLPMENLVFMTVVALAPNMSVGVNVTLKLLALAAKSLPTALAASVFFNPLIWSFNSPLRVEAAANVWPLPSSTICA